MNRSLTDRIDGLLPQMQCTRCGYPSCREYAEALAGRRTMVNRCPPGGEATIASLADLLDEQPRPLDPACGEPAPLAVSVIDERWCIGCAVCVKVCPVDAIVGAPGLMHTVIAAECTGCGLCVQPCPTSCIEMVAVQDHPQRGRLSATWTPARADLARHRYRHRQDRLKRREGERSDRLRRVSLRRAALSEKKDAIEQAVLRVGVSKERSRDESDQTG